jgi:hypothetical protein
LRCSTYRNTGLNGCVHRVFINEEEYEFVDIQEKYKCTLNVLKTMAISDEDLQVQLCSHSLCSHSYIWKHPKWTSHKPCCCQ